MAKSSRPSHADEARRANVLLEELRGEIRLVSENQRRFEAEYGTVKLVVLDLAADMAILKPGFQAIAKDIAVLKEDVQVLKTDVSQLKTDMTVVKTDVRDIKDELRTMDRRLIVVESARPSA